jgi:NAD(P)H-hydrate repair Nnr-like enzyme with NAD(P)H-hydrate epimerase domain
MLRALVAAALIAFAALGTAGCGGKVIDDQKAETAIKADFERSTGVKVTSVDCPGNVDVKPGATFDCTVNAASGRSATVTLKILNDNADVKPIALHANK